MTGFVAHANNDQLTASSYYASDDDDVNTHYGPQRSRLYTAEIAGRLSGGWSSQSNSIGEYIQVDFRTLRRVERVATQGRNHQTANQWVTSYRFASSIDSTIYEFVQNLSGADQIFDGNFDYNTLIQHDFDPAFVARYVRLYPQTWNNHICMRWEVYGCDIGENNRIFLDRHSVITALC